MLEYDVAKLSSTSVAYHKTAVMLVMEILQPCTNPSTCTIPNELDMMSIVLHIHDDIETLSASLLSLCARNSLVTVGFTPQKTKQNKTKNSNMSPLYFSLLPVRISCSKKCHFEAPRHVHDVTVICHSWIVNWCKTVWTNHKRIKEYAVFFCMTRCFLVYSGKQYAM